MQKIKKNKVVDFALLAVIAYGVYKIPVPESSVTFDAISGANPPMISPRIEWASEPDPAWYAFKKDKESLKSPIAAHAKFYKKQSGENELDRESLNQIGRVYGIPDDVLYYQNYMESRGDCKAKSRKGAVGCFQFTQTTAKEFGLISKKGDFRRQFRASADAAARYMLWLTIVMYGDEANPADWEQLRHVLAAYNAGYGAVTKTGKPEIPNFYETIKYVQHIEDLVKGMAVVVQKGDSLEDISVRVSVPVDVLMRGNPSVTETQPPTPDTILSLPDENGMARLVVGRGMSLAKIQGNTGVKVADLIRVNQLKSSKIHPGLVLQIPTVM